MKAPQNAERFYDSVYLASSLLVVNEYPHQHGPSMIYPISCPNGKAQEFCLARSQRVVFHLNALFHSGFHNQSGTSRRDYARRFLCTVVSISFNPTFYTARFNSFWGRYNHLETTCQFLQVSHLAFSRHFPLTLEGPPEGNFSPIAIVFYSSTFF